MSLDRVESSSIDSEDILDTLYIELIACLNETQSTCAKLMLVTKQGATGKASSDIKMSSGSNNFRVSLVK